MLDILFKLYLLCRTSAIYHIDISVQQWHLLQHLPCLCICMYGHKVVVIIATETSSKATTQRVHFGQSVSSCLSTRCMIVSQHALVMLCCKAWKPWQSQQMSHEWPLPRRCHRHCCHIITVLTHVNEVIQHLHVYIHLKK